MSPLYLVEKCSAKIQKILDHGIQGHGSPVSSLTMESFYAQTNFSEFRRSREITIESGQIFYEMTYLGREGTK